MENRNLLLAIVAVAITFSSCSSVDKKAALIPRDAAFVIHINTNSLSSKVTWDDVKKSNWFTEMASDQRDSFAKQILDDPSSSGIDTKEGLFVFGKMAMKGFSYAGFTGQLKDEKVFESFNKKTGKTDTVVNKDGLKTILFGEKGSVTWNDNKFLYLVGSNFGHWNYADSNRVYQESSKVDLSDLSRRIFNYKKDSLLISDDRFTSLLKDEADVHLWSNAESIASENSSLGMLSIMSGADVYFRQSVTATTLNFEKGKIAMHSKMYSNEQMQEILKKYSGEKINADLVQRIPSDNIVGLIAANYKPEGLKQLLKLGGLDGVVNSFLGEYQLTLDELVAASKGDLLISVSDVGTKKKMMSMGEGTDSVPISAPSFNVLVAMTVNNKATFEKLASVATQKLNESGKSPIELTFKVNNDLFVAGTNNSFVDQYLNGTKRDIPFLSKISGHPLAMYLDFSKLTASFLKDTSESDFARSTSKMWKDLVITGGEFKDGAVVQDAEVNLVDQNTNSLQQLNAYADKLVPRKKPF